MITGRSVHNQRIERLWHDIWCSVLSNYYAAFHHLEDTGFLDPNDDLHIACPQFVMIPRINAHLDIFRSTWDRHRLSSQGQKSPQHLWISGQISSADTLCDQSRTGAITSSEMDNKTEHRHHTSRLNLIARFPMQISLPLITCKTIHQQTFSHRHPHNLILYHTSQHYCRLRFQQNHLHTPPTSHNIAALATVTPLSSATFMPLMRTSNPARDFGSIWPWLKKGGFGVCMTGTFEEFNNNQIINAYPLLKSVHGFKLLHCTRSQNLTNKPIPNSGSSIPYLKSQRGLNKAMTYIAPLQENLPLQSVIASTEDTDVVKEVRSALELFPFLNWRNTFNSANGPKGKISRRKCTRVLRKTCCKKAGTTNGHC
ncbi:uncharacterized protein LOC125249055 isoform X1 [Megalobrama amblycephala]|uniref:uncharacterized protein LOC125249055 isoform X1 n=1 Tax=Megalobrama amblycephala TaxID=75352 RepID=UPI0020144934|nr:uncharacterized protein LOC125249055 isoform X1 [Megalobrama amblycephala]XP_048017202.1 uncharacterized protein LOC125249055 isoform X1 [Megalobrama amblycephala]